MDHRDRLDEVARYLQRGGQGVLVTWGRASMHCTHSVQRGRGGACIASKRQLAGQPTRQRQAHALLWRAFLAIKPSFFFLAGDSLGSQY